MRVFLLFAVLCALCSSASSSLPQLRFGISYLPGRPERCGVLEQLAREYTAANVTITCFTSGQTNTFATRVLNSQNPEADILALLISDIGKYAELGALAEMTDVINDPAFLKTDFFDGTLAGSEYPVNSNRYYAAPFAADMLGFTYRKSVFAAHNKTVPGFLEDLPPLLEYFKSLPEFSGGAALYTCTKSTDSICSALRFTNALVADMFMFGNGGSLWNPDTYQITDQLDSDANVEAFQMAKRIFDAGVNQSVAIGYTDMVNNQVASMCGTPGAPPIALAYTSLSELATTTTCPTAMQDTGFFAIPFPKVNRASHVPLFSSSLVVPSRSPNVDAAKQFIAYMTSRAAQKRGLAWGFAVRKSVVIDPAFVFDGPTHALQSRLVFVQSLQRAKPYTVSLPMATQLLNIQDDFVVSFINTPTNQVTAASVKQSLSRLAVQQQGLVDAYFPCGPVCPEIIRRSSAASYATLASHCIALFGCLCLAVAMFWFRNEPVMRASSIPFMSLILLGASGMFIGGIVMHSDDPTDGMCVAPLWTLHLGWFVVFMAILVKTYRIAAIFNRKVISKVSLTDAQLIRYFLLFVGLFFIYLLIWTFVLRPVSSIATSTTSSGLKQQWTECDMGALETWDTLLEFLLLMCLAVMAFQVRAAPSAFHEAKALGIAVYNWVIIVALVFLLRSMGSGLEAKTLAADLHILLTAPVVLSCLFGPKFYAIYTGAAVTTDGSSSGGGKATGSGAAATPGNCVSQLNAPTSTVSPRSKKFGPSASPSETSKKVPRPTLSSSSARPQSPQLDKPNVSTTEGGKSVELSQVCVAEESNVESQQTAQYAFSVSSE